MPRKDRDVWDPPEDLKVVEPPPSAFMQHFQDRAMRVGRDGKNAQLVRVKEAKPVRWTDGSNRKKDGGAGCMQAFPGDDMDGGGGVNRKRLMRLPLQSRGHVGGIVAPDEIKTTVPARQRPLVMKYNSGSNSSASISQKLVGKLPVDTLHVARNREAQHTLAPLRGLSSGSQNGNPIKTAATMVSSHPDVPDATSFSGGCKSHSAEVLSVEVSRPIRKLPSSSRPLSNASVEFIPTENGLRKPLTRLPTRKINVYGNVDEEAQMPKSKMMVRSPANMDQMQKRSNSSNDNDRKHCYSRMSNSTNNGKLSRVSAAGELDYDFDDDSVDCGGGKNDLTRGESLDIPMYQPIGTMVTLSQSNPFKRRGSRKNNNNNSNNRQPTAKKKRSAGSGAVRPVTDEDRRESRLDPQRHAAAAAGDGGKNYSALRKELSNSPPARLRPLKLPIRPSRSDTQSVESSAVLTDTKEGDHDDEKKKSPSYKSYKLKDYKLMMEHVANLKLGGLGPTDTDEQRQAREKMQRQRQYGEIVGKQAVEKIRKKNQQRLLLVQQQQDGETAAECGETPTKKTLKQPPPPERVQAQERRARALEYARNIPPPEPSATRKNNNNNNNDGDSMSSGSNLLHRRLPRDEAALRREERLRELEARHYNDRERVAVVKRQLGY